MSRTSTIFERSGKSAQIVDSLTSLSHWRGAGASLVGGKLVITPTLGGNILLNGDMETGNPPSNWTLQNGATLSGVADERTGGTGAQSLNIARGTAAQSAYQVKSGIAVGVWLYLSGWLKNVDATSANLRMTSGASVSDGSAQADTSWGQSAVTLRCVSGDAYAVLFVNGASGQNARFDDLALNIITLSTTMVLRRCRLPTFNMTTPLASTLTTGTQMGIIFGLDDPNLVDLGTATFGMAYYDGAGNVVTVKCTAGSYGTPTSTASAWGATKKLDLKKSDAQTYQVYNSTTDFGTTVGAAQTIAGLTGQWYGHFSTYSGNQFDPAVNQFKMVPYAA